MGTIKKIEIYSEKILKDRKILLISDIHKEKGHSEKHLNLIKEKLAKGFSDIDFIVIPGDIVNDANDLKDLSFKSQLREELTEFLSGKKAIVSVGNHDQMTLSSSNRWESSSPELIYEGLEEIPNMRILRNGENILDGEISFSAFSPNVRYYTERKENIDDYKKAFFEIYNEELFSQQNYNIFLTHEPQSIIKLSKMNKECIQPYTDLVVSGHMHNGLLPNMFHRFCKNRGILSPQFELFPEFAQGTYKIDNTDFVINGAVNTRVEMPFINDLYGYNATVIDIKTKQKNNRRKN